MWWTLGKVVVKTHNHITTSGGTHSSGTYYMALFVIAGMGAFLSFLADNFIVIASVLFGIFFLYTIMDKLFFEEKVELTGKFLTISVDPSDKSFEKIKEELLEKYNEDFKILSNNDKLFHLKHIETEGTYISVRNNNNTKKIEIEYVNIEDILFEEEGEVKEITETKTPFFISFFLTLIFIIFIFTPFFYYLYYFNIGYEPSDIYRKAFSDFNLIIEHANPYIEIIKSKINI